MPTVEAVQKHNKMHQNDKCKEAEMNRNLDKQVFNMSYQLNDTQFKFGVMKTKK